MKTKYSILFCIPSLASTGGMEKVITAKANYFADVLGYDVYILISDQNKKPITFPLSNKIQYRDLNINLYTSNKIKGLSFIKNIKTLKTIYSKEILKINPDIIIVPERGYEDFIIPNICKHIPKIREYHFSRKASALLEKEMPLVARIKSVLIKQSYFFQFKKYDSLVVLTEKDKKEWTNIKHVTVIPNYILDNNLPHNNILDRTNKVISVGSMQNNRKGFSELITIWSKLKVTSNWTLHIYGDGALKPKLQNQIKDLSIEKSVFLEGNSSEITEKYQESQLFLFASKGEGLPMVMLEAQQNGLPIVAYDCYCGPSDILKNDNAGFLVPMNNESKFIDCCESLLEKRDLRQSKSHEAYKNSKKYNQQSIMPLWQNLFKTLIK